VPARDVHELQEQGSGWTKRAIRPVGGT